LTPFGLFYNSFWYYIGIEGKYNFVDYNNPKGTDLSGDAVTINLIYCGFGKKYDPVTLKELDYTH
jgi:hypothetical protein